jgi:hypothetical protein
LTNGIAACGPNAGLLICRSLRAVEHVNTGSIGWFATFAAIELLRIAISVCRIMTTRCPRGLAL